MKVLPCITGIKVYFSDGEAETNGETDLEDVYEFMLAPGERIVQVVIGYGYMIDRIGFVANTGQRYGPYGGAGGNTCTEKPPGGSYGYLVSIAGHVVKAEDKLGINNLEFCWALRTLPEKASSPPPVKATVTICQ